MIVFAPQLLEAAEEMRTQDRKLWRLHKEPVTVTAAQLQRAGEILRDGPQPIANGIKSDMPGFFHAEDQEKDDTVLTLHVGILPSTAHHIARDGSLLDAEVFA